MIAVHAPLPPAPPEPPVIVSLDGLAPGFRSRLEATLRDTSALGLAPYLVETLRTDARQDWLFGLGRDYDVPGDIRGVVTNAPTGDWSWHKYGLAADVAFHGRRDYFRLGKLAKLNGLAWGGDWPRFTDNPHVQFGLCRQSPSSKSIELFAAGGYEAVWRAVGALV